MDDSEWKTLLKSMIWGYHYFWKHPCTTSTRWFKVTFLLIPVVGGHKQPLKGSLYYHPNKSHKELSGTGHVSTQHFLVKGFQDLSVYTMDKFPFTNFTVLTYEILQTNPKPLLNHGAKTVKINFACTKCRKMSPTSSSLDITPRLKLEIAWQSAK